MSPSIRPVPPELEHEPTFPSALRRAVAQFGSDDFVVLPDERMTYAEADARSRVLAKRFVAAGLGKGARVGLFFTYSTEFVVAWLAALRIGALVMPFSSIYKPAELETVLRIGDVQLLLAGPSCPSQGFTVTGVGYIENRALRIFAVDNSRDRIVAMVVSLPPI